MKEVKISNADKTLTFNTEASTVSELFKELIEQKKLAADTSVSAVILYNGDYVEPLAASIKGALSIDQLTELGISGAFAEEQAVQEPSEISVTISYGAGIIAPIRVDVRRENNTVYAAITAPSVLNVLNKTPEDVSRCKITVNGRKAALQRELHRRRK